MENIPLNNDVPPEELPTIKIVREERSPVSLRAFRGTNDKVREQGGTDFGFLGKGSYSHTLPEVANSYALSGGVYAGGNVTAEQIQLDNPFHWGERGYGISSYLNGHGKVPPLIEKILQDAGIPKWDGKIARFGKRPLSEIANEASTIVTKELMRLGYDGVIADSEGGQEVVVFSKWAKPAESEHADQDHFD